MKILYYSPHPQLNYTASTGYGTHMREMVNAFEKLGHEVKLCIVGGTENSNQNKTIKEPSTAKKILKSIIPKIIWSSLKDWQLIKRDKIAQKTLQQSVETFQPDLIYERGFYCMISGCNVAEQFNIPHIVEINAPFEYEKELFEGKTLLKSYTRKLEQKILTQPNLICVVASSIKDYYLTRHPFINPNKIIITPNAINSDLVKVSPIKFIKEKFSDRVVVGFVGSIFPYHGVDKLLLSFAEANPVENKIGLLIVGDGEILEDLKEKAKTLNIENEVIFTGKVPHKEVYSYINEMDIAVLANTEWYCSPVKLFDYGAVGKAIIAINKIGVTDVMENGKDGIIINKDSELTEAILKLIKDENLRKTVGSTFRNKVLSNHTWKTTAKKVLNSINTQ